jgi:hypothetical protein
MEDTLEELCIAESGQDREKPSRGVALKAVRRSPLPTMWIWGSTCLDGAGTVSRIGQVLQSTDSRPVAVAGPALGVMIGLHALLRTPLESQFI